jgi:hypothetical protein
MIQSPPALSLNRKRSIYWVPGLLAGQRDELNHADCPLLFVLGALSA